MYVENYNKTLMVASMFLQGPEAPSMLTVAFMRKPHPGPAQASRPFHPPGAQRPVWQLPSSPFIKGRGFLAFF